MKIDIVSTGSRGNMNLVDQSICIDFGVSRQTFLPRLPDLDVILVSHRHDDHISLPVIRMLKRERPALLSRLYVNQDTWELINDADPTISKLVRNVVDDKSTFSFKTRSGLYVCETFPLVHDVENQGFILTNQHTGETLIHATDTETMKHAPTGRVYDYILVEGNWDEDKLFEQLQSDEKHAVFRASRNLRHLSVQDLVKFVAAHSKPTSRVYQLHMSEEYGIDAVNVTTEALVTRLEPRWRG